MPERATRVALIGAGMISEYHLRGWAKAADAEVVAVVDPDPARSALRARQFGIPLQFPSLEAMLDRIEVDALDIASPRETRDPILRAAAQRGIPCLCQKPFMPTLAEADALVRDLDGRPRMMVNQNFRFRPYYVQMRQWMRDIGPVTGCTINCRSSGLIRNREGKYPYIERQPFVRGETRLMIEEVLIHRIDVARWLCGPLELIAARTARNCDELAGESEAAMLFVTGERGAPVVIDGNFMSHGHTERSQDRVEITGAHARILFEDSVLRLIGPRTEELRFDEAVAYQQSFDATIAHFVEGLRAGTPFLTSAEDNLETLRLVEAAYAAAGRVH